METNEIRNTLIKALEEWGCSYEQMKKVFDVSEKTLYRARKNRRQYQKKLSTENT